MTAESVFSLKDKLKQYASNFSGGIKEGLELVRDYPERFKSKTLAGKVLSLAKLTSIPVSMALTSGTSLTTQALGATMLAGAFTIGRMKNNKHQNALSAPLAYTIATQKYLLGAQGYAIMSGIAGTRGLVMSMLPDTKESQPLRNKVALAFAGTGIVGVGMTALFISPWNLLPVGSMLLGTLASSKINEKSYLARPLHVIANTNNAIYSALYSGSAAATILDLTGVANSSKTISENDIPQKRKSGTPLSTKEKVKSYLSLLFNDEQKTDYLSSADIQALEEENKEVSPQKVMIP